MKRASNIFSLITDFNNLRLAYLKALKGKRNSVSALLFDMRVDENLTFIKNQLDSENYKIGNYRQFKIYDPKERIITAANFEDRIVHHAIMNVLESVFERQFIFHTYACRKGKGTHRAVQYAFSKAKKYKYYIKLDVRKYFYSIKHDKLKVLIERIIKDKRCLHLLYAIIDSFDGGLPIGNLTSQFFANYYLSPLDHFVLEQLKVGGYVRYMDDIIVFSNSKAQLKNICSEMERFVEPFSLTFKQPVFNVCKNGILFLGYLIKPANCKLLNKTRKRRIKKVQHIIQKFNQGVFSNEDVANRLRNIQLTML